MPSNINFRIKTAVATKALSDISGHAVLVKFVYDFDLSYDVSLTKSYFNDINIHGYDLSGDIISCDVSGGKTTERQNYFHDSISSLDHSGNIWSVQNDASSTELLRLSYDLSNSHIPSDLDNNLPVWVEVIITHSIEKAVEDGDLSGNLELTNVQPDPDNTSNFFGLYNIMTTFKDALGDNGQDASGVSHRINDLIEDCSGQTGDDFFRSTVGVWLRQIQANHTRHSELMDLSGSEHTFDEILKTNDKIEVLLIIRGGSTDVSGGIVISNSAKQLGTDCNPSGHRDVSHVNDLHQRGNITDTVSLLADDTIDDYHHEPIALRLIYTISE